MPLSTADIRKAFQNYFVEKHGHKQLPSASLIPSNPTVLLTPAGMLPFVPVFMGIEPAPNPPRATSSQKCARVSGKASDLSFVGRTTRHHTFFEMLGNFSFGDYFKEEAIPWAWDFVTNVLKLPKEKLYVSVYFDDDESRQIWHQKCGIALDRIWSRDEKDNFWGPPGPTGPCGPCTEIYYDLGDHIQDEEDRYIEIWNVVCMELFQDADGKRTPLKAKNIDTGMGLERIAMVVQGVSNTFETDLLFAQVKKLAELTKQKYGQSEELNTTLKIIVDHIRCVAFAIADGIIPSNEGRGYVIRMILRRAVRYAKSIGVNEPLLFKLVSTIRDCYQDPYVELKEKYDLIVDTIKAEERRFLETLDRGSKLLEEKIAELQASKKSTLSGDDAFKLYDTYGFPLELTQELCEEKSITVDETGFDAALEAQKQRARKGKQDATIVSDQLYADLLGQLGATEFLGYDTLEAQCQITAIIADGKTVNYFEGTNQPIEIILNQTPFYPEGGGQVGDQGILYVQDGQYAQTIVVQETKKVGELIIHKCLFDQGEPIKVGTTIQAEVAPDARSRTAAHHSATHLMHAALKKVLGDHVGQAGSLVTPTGARFDFNFQRGLNQDELFKVEMMVNRWITQNAARETLLTSPDEAKAQGAVAMFGEKYGDTVRVIGFSEFSKELCGGTHVERTGDIGPFKITSEGSIASGVRRIEFVVGDLALFQTQQQLQVLQEASQLLKTNPSELKPTIEKLLEQTKQLERQLKEQKEKEALVLIKALIEKNQGQQIIVEQVFIDDADILKWTTEQLAKSFADNHVILLGASIEGRAQFCSSVSNNWVTQGIKASDLVKQAATICEGGGGGKPNFAQAGGKNPSKITEALKAVYITCQESLNIKA